MMEIDTKRCVLRPNWWFSTLCKTTWKTYKSIILFLEVCLECPNKEFQCQDPGDVQKSDRNLVNKNIAYNSKCLPKRRRKDCKSFVKFNLNRKQKTRDWVIMSPVKNLNFASSKRQSSLVLKLKWWIQRPDIIQISM